MAPPMSLFAADRSCSPQRGRICSVDSSESAIPGMEGAMVCSSSTAESDGTSVFMDHHGSSMHCNPTKYRSPIDSIEDLTASILDRVSHITISADSWTMDATVAAAEVSFTEEEEEETKSEDLEIPPAAFFSSPLVASPLRLRAHKRRLAPPTPLHYSMMTPRASNVPAYNMLPCSNDSDSSDNSGPRVKRRRQAPALPNSPVVDLTARIAHGPVFTPFFRYDARLDRFASQTTTFSTSVGTTDDDDFGIPLMIPPTDDTTATPTAIVNPFTLPISTQPSNWVTTTPPVKRVRRRRRLRMRTVPFPSFPCLSPMRQQREEAHLSSMQSPTLYCSPISNRKSYL